MIIGEDKLTIEDVVKYSAYCGGLVLSASKGFEEKIERGARFIEETLEKTGTIYGVTTGYGDSCTEIVPPENYYDLPLNLTRYHGCGLGAYFDEQTTRAIMIVRLNTLSQGFSGVSMELLRRISFFIENGVLPLIPEEGSVGASGDLTPLSYLAGALAGEREVRFRGEVKQASAVLAEFGVPPYRFRPKEAIAIMNGTAVMNAIAALNFYRAGQLADLACRISAISSLALQGNIYHFNKRLFELKPHAGQTLAAEKIRSALEKENSNGEHTQVLPERIQDPYSVRCAPHVIGLFYDVEETLRRLIETEMNSVNDNPIVDPETESIYHGGHFYGGHICFAMDSLKNIIANIADLADRQLALLVDVKYNRGLAPNLSGSAKGYSFNHGFKAVQIGASAWTAEALKNTMPASVFSRSTECHNQDKVSMGTIAARDCTRVISLTSQVLAAALLGSVQALYLRLQQGGLSETSLKEAYGAEQTYRQVLSVWKPLEDDRPLEADLRNTVRLIENGFFKMDGGQL